jgi:serine/threonine protein kinase
MPGPVSVVTPASSSRRFLAPGDQLGKHAVIRQIAVGGMAELYLTRTVGIEGFEKLVVLKRILPHLVEDEEFFTMFLDEARLAARIRHPNVVPTLDVIVNAPIADSPPARREAMISRPAPRPSSARSRPTAPS